MTTEMPSIRQSTNQLPDDSIRLHSMIQNSDNPNSQEEINAENRQNEGEKMGGITLKPSKFFEANYSKRLI